MTIFVQVIEAHWSFKNLPYIIQCLQYCQDGTLVRQNVPRKYLPTPYNDQQWSEAFITGGKDSWFDAKL